MKPIPKAAIVLLRDAADQVSNNTCNDYAIPDTPENREFIIDMMKYHNDDEFDIDQAISSGQLYTLDWMVLDYIAYLVEAANK